MIQPPNPYVDVGTRTLRQLQTFNFPATITSSTTVALANTVPQRSQGDEIFAAYFTPYSTSSWIEVEIMTAVNTTTNTTFWIALFNDYQNDAMAVTPGYYQAGVPIVFKHYFQPLQAGIPTRYSIRCGAVTSSVVFNYWSYGGKNVSRMTFKEWSALSLQNT